MTTKEINAALKSGQQVTFHQHIQGTSFGYDHKPVTAAKTVKGQTFVKIIFNYRGKYGTAWNLVQPNLDDYVSITLSPGVPEVSNVVSN
jgi:hypothetical protein